jgi:hypothetical protein
VDVTIRVLRHEVAMRLTGILDVELRHVTLSDERPDAAVSQLDRHDEIVQSRLIALNGLSGRQHHRDANRLGRRSGRRASAACGRACQPDLLQLTRIRIARGNAAKVAGRRVALGARRGEVRLARGGVADDDRRWPVAGGIPP